MIRALGLTIDMHAPHYATPSDTAAPKPEACAHLQGAIQAFRIAKSQLRALGTLFLPRNFLLVDVGRQA